MKPGKSWAVAADLGALSPGASPYPPLRPCRLPETRSPAPRPLSCQVYSADGEFLFKFGSHGEGNGQFNAPTGVAVDSNGNIIVADWGNSRIQVSKAQEVRFPTVPQAHPHPRNASRLPVLTSPSFSTHSPGFRQLWLLPLLHQHVCRATVRPTGPGTDFGWPRGGGRCWQPLL